MNEIYFSTQMNLAFDIHYAVELWQREHRLPCIPTFSQCLDNIIGDGLPVSALTEIVGLPGTGKTQLCLQLCASVQIPQVLRGLNAEALYIDTNTNFTIQRFKEILSSSLLRCQQLLNTSFLINEEDALKKLHYVNAYGLEPFCTFMHRLPTFLADQTNIKLIVIDSIAFPFKNGISAKQRTGLLYRQMTALQRIAVERHIAIVVTNEISTRLDLDGGSVTAALGDAWAHRCNSRLLLSRPDNSKERTPRVRQALLLKGINANAVASFQITDEGIRDVD